MTTNSDSRNVARMLRTFAPSTVGRIDRDEIIEECAREAEDRVTSIAVGANKQYWNGRDDAAALIRALKATKSATPLVEKEQK